jgi:hypothetical protein
MRKKLFLGVAMACSVFASRAQYSITNYQSATAGITENSPVDIEFNPSSRHYVSLHSNTVGMSVVDFDGVTGNRLNSLNFFRAGTGFNPIKIMHNGADSYILFSYVINATNRFAICKYNNTTNVIQWAKVLSNAANNIDVYPTDIAIDPSGNAYVLGNRSSNGVDNDVFISEISSAGTLLWFEDYSNSTYDENATNITYDAGTNEFIVGGTAIDVNNFLNRNILVWRVNPAGTIILSTLLSYSNPSARINGACAKRLGKSIYVTATSIIGADGAGPFLVAKLAGATLAPIVYNVYIGPTYFNPEFNFTNTNADLVLSGDASFVNTGTPGMVNTMFALATCTFVSESRYTTMGSFAWGGPIANTYAPVYNELGMICQDPVTASHFYFVKSRFDGYTSCDVNASYSLQAITLNGTLPIYITSNLDVTFGLIKLFGVQAMSHDGVRTCSYVPCPLCEFPTYDGAKSMSTASAEQLPSLSIYPNPANDRVTIATGDKLLGSVELYDMSGRLIVSEMNVSAASATFNVSGLEKAIYLLKITYTDGSTDVKRFAKE